MFQMLSCFDLKPGVGIEEFRANYANFVAYMRDSDLIESSGPIGRRQSNTPMDTDDERDHEFFVIMFFRDRAQVDAAYDHILPHEDPADGVHNAVFSKVQDPVFICWQDLED